MKTRCFRVMAVALSGLLALAGCTFETGPVADAATGEDALWVEPIGEGGFRVAALPAERGAQVEISVVPAAPDWYIGPGLYVSLAGGYAREVDGTGLTLDDVLIVWDAAPSTGE